MDSPARNPNDCAQINLADRDAPSPWYGGRDNGPPGLRPHYGPHYYAACVIDPDGYRIEAVINAAE